MYNLYNRITQPKLIFNHISDRQRETRALITSVVGISASFVILCSPYVWNVFRQLFMNYNVRVMLQARDSGAGEFFNYEYHIAIFILSLNNSVNFFVYILSGTTWRKLFIKSIKAKLQWLCNAVLMKHGESGSL